MIKIGMEEINMKCENCGCQYLVEDAIYEFEKYFDGLDYRSEISDHLCAECAIDYMEDKIRNQ